MTLLDRIRNWRLRNRIPTNVKERRWRYAPNGIDIIPVKDEDEIRKYNYARKRQKEKDDFDDLMPP